MIIEATEPWQFTESGSLLARQYAAHRIPTPAWSGPVTRLLSFRGADIAGSIDLIPDTFPNGMPILSYYAREVGPLRRLGLVEVGHFATDGLRRGELLELLGEVAMRLVDGPGGLAVCGVHPTWCELYRRFMGWEVAGKPRTLPGSDRAVILMTLDRDGYRGSVLGRRIK